MHYLWLVPYYITWHYTFAIIELFKAWKNFIWFFWYYFSVGLSLRTLFSPFERMKERYNMGPDLGKVMEVLVVNIISRIIGFVLRTIIILLGLLVILLVIVLGIATLIIWLLLPFILGFVLINGIRALVSSPYDI